MVPNKIMRHSRLLRMGFIIIIIIIIIIINTLFEIGKNLHSSAKNAQSNLYQLKIIIIK